MIVQMEYLKPFVLSKEIKGGVISNAQYMIEFKFLYDEYCKKWKLLNEEYQPKFQTLGRKYNAKYGGGKIPEYWQVRHVVLYKNYSGPKWYLKKLIQYVAKEADYLMGFEDLHIAYCYMPFLEINELLVKINMASSNSELKRLLKSKGIKFWNLFDKQIDLSDCENLYHFEVRKGCLILYVHILDGSLYTQWYNFLCPTWPYTFCFWLHELFKYRMWPKNKFRIFA